MKVNAQRLWDHIQELGKIGEAEDGSITRFPFTTEDKRAQDLIMRYMEEAGLKVTIDAVGNMIGTLQGEDETHPILCGSHYDSVKHGGKFDGCLGVLAGIEVLHVIKEEQKTPNCTIKIIAFKDEEGNRFGYGMVGSKSISGTMQEEGFSSEDEHGITLKQAMEQSGFHPMSYRDCEIPNPKMYLEVHIEQAKLLEKYQVPLGIVDGIAGLVRYRVEFKGESGHAGATPMEDRKDPVVAMSRWISRITELVQQEECCVATVGSIQTFPGACNIICDHVVCSLDLRSIYEDKLTSILKKMEDYNHHLNREFGIQVRMRKEQFLPACLCDNDLKQRFKKICKSNAIPFRSLMSGAGHDAMNFKDKCPVGMLFVRSRGGYSHRQEEYSSMDDCAVAAQVLYEFLKETAYDLE